VLMGDVLMVMEHMSCVMCLCVRLHPTYMHAACAHVHVRRAMCAAPARCACMIVLQKRCASALVVCCRLRHE
jgi:hypothetical protein